MDAKVNGRLATKLNLAAQQGWRQGGSFEGYALNLNICDYIDFGDVGVLVGVMKP